MKMILLLPLAKANPQWFLEARDHKGRWTRGGMNQDAMRKKLSGFNYVNHHEMTPEEIAQDRAAFMERHPTQFAANDTLRTRKDIHRVADKITRAAERLGYWVDRHEADSGSTYLQCTLGDADVSLKIRVANHMRVYDADYSVAPEDGSAAGAVRLLAQRAGKPEPKWVTKWYDDARQAAGAQYDRYAAEAGARREKLLAEEQRLERRYGPKGSPAYEAGIKAEAERAARKEQERATRRATEDELNAAEVARRAKESLRRTNPKQAAVLFDGVETSPTKRAEYQRHLEELKRQIANTMRREGTWVKSK